MGQVQHARDALEWISREYENRDLGHIDFRIGAAKRANAALAHLVEEPSPPAAAPSRATPAIVAALQQAVARVEIANGEGNMILSAWLPDARAALDMHESEQTAPETAAALTPRPARVIVARYEHAHGEDVRMFASDDGAEAWRQEIARQWSADWYSNKTDGEKLPDDPAARADAYFDLMSERGSEFFNTESFEVEADPAPATLTPQQITAEAVANLATKPIYDVQTGLYVPTGKAGLPYFKATIEVLLKVDSDAEACDAIAEPIREMLNAFQKDGDESAWIDWKYAPNGHPEPHDGAGFEYAEPAEESTCAEVKAAAAADRA